MTKGKEVTFLLSNSNTNFGVLHMTPKVFYSLLQKAPANGELSKSVEDIVH